MIRFSERLWCRPDKIAVHGRNEAVHKEVCWLLASAAFLLGWGLFPGVLLQVVCVCVEVLSSAEVRAIPSGRSCKGRGAPLCGTEATQ